MWVEASVENDGRSAPTFGSLTVVDGVISDEVSDEMASVSCDHVDVRLE